jgi:hypothetical protein
MAKAKKKARKSKPIITGYLEKVSAKIFDDYSSVITNMVKGHQGVYSLYKKDKLYYVGLASNLKNRIKFHLRDKHQGKWTHFSLYIIRKENHIKELESLVLRIAYPKGNRQKGKLAGSKNIRPLLKEKLNAEWKRKRSEILDTKKPAKLKKKTKRRFTKTPKSDRPLKGVFSGGKVIYATYKGKEYKAWVLANGGIKYNGQIYATPSAAGKAIITKGAVNGWNFWKYKDEKGNLVKLTEIRK